MFVEFTIWGAWLPVLAIRLLGPLRMTGKQVGWVYATVPLACTFAPFVSGYLADRWINVEWILVVCHAAGAVLLFLAARQTTFRGMFCAMLVFSIFYTATPALINKMLNLAFPADDPKLAWVQPWVFLWAPVAWAFVGFLLTGIRQVWKMGGDGPDCLYLAALLSLIMVAICALQSTGGPSPVGNPMGEALAMLRNPHYLLFILTELVVAAMMPFYLLGTGPFMQDRGISGKNVSGAMGIAQAAQAAATMLLLGWFLDKAGFRWTFVTGTLCLTALYATYSVSRRASWIVLVQVLFGLECVFCMAGGQMFVNATAPAQINASAQSLIFIATYGVGQFLGTQLAGLVMERNLVNGKFQWPKIWLVPLTTLLIVVLVLVTAFKAPERSQFQKCKSSPQKAVACRSQDYPSQ